MDMEEILRELERQLADARPVPLSASVMVNATELQQLAHDVRAALPEEIRQARWILKERDQVMASAEREAEDLREDARLERQRLISETEVVRAAQREAEHIIAEAQEEARVLRLECEDYVDSKLANFEIVLQKTMGAVEKGRERLRGRLASDELSPEEIEQAQDGRSRVYDYEA